MSSTLVLGIDVAKDTVEIASRPAQIHGEFANTRAGHQKLLKALAGHSIQLIVVEATGGYERALAAELAQADYRVVVANPRQVRHFAYGVGELAKTDPIDANTLAFFGEVVKPTPKPTQDPNIESLAELVTRRRQLVGLLTQETNRLPMCRHIVVRKSVRKMIKTLEHQIKQIDELIQDHIQADDNFQQKNQILRSTPGIGPKTSSMLLAHVPELGHLNRHQIAALIGLAPYDRRSGTLVRPAHIAGGRQHVRCALYMATVTARRCNPVIRHFAQRLEAQGKSFKVVITACMRKLLVILNAMIREQTPWSAESITKNS